MADEAATVLSTLSKGQRLGPCHRIVRVFGTDNGAELYEVEHVDLKKRMAAKILPPMTALDEAARKRFAHDSRVIAQIEHPGLIRMIDLGELEDGRCFVIQEHHEGERLSVRLGRGPLPVPEAAWMASRIATALAVAHAHGAYHRALSPGSVVLARAPFGTLPKIGDFGVAHFDNSEASDGAGQDVRAFGALLLRLLGGRVDAETGLPSSLPRDTPVALGSLLTRSLEPGRVHGAETMGEMAQALRTIAGELEPARAPVVTGSGGAHAATPHLLASIPVRRERLGRDSWSYWLLRVVPSLMFMAIGGWGLVSRTTRAIPPAPMAPRQYHEPSVIVVPRPSPLPSNRVLTGREVYRLIREAQKIDAQHAKLLLIQLVELGINDPPEPDPRRTLQLARLAAQAQAIIVSAEPR